MKIRNFKLKKRKGNVFPIFLFIIVTIFGMLLLLQNTSNKILTINQKARFQTNYVAQVGLDMVLEATQRYPLEMYKAAEDTVGDTNYKMPQNGDPWATLPVPSGSGTADIYIELIPSFDSMGKVAEVEVVSTAVYGDTTAVKSMRMFVVDRTITAINSPFENNSGAFVNDYFTAVPPGVVGTTEQYPYVKGRYDGNGTPYAMSGGNLLDSEGKEIVFTDNATDPSDIYENYDGIRIKRTFTDENLGTTTIKEKTAQNIWFSKILTRFSNGLRFEIINNSDSSMLRSAGNTFIGIDAGNRETAITIKDYIKVTGKKDTNIVLDTKTLIIDGLTTPEIATNESKRKGIITTSAEIITIENIPSARNNPENIFDYYLYAPNAEVTIKNSDGATFTGSIVAKKLEVYDNAGNRVYTSDDHTKKLTALRNIIFSDKNYQGDFYTEIGKKYTTVDLPTGVTSIPNYEFIFVEYR